MIDQNVISQEVSQLAMLHSCGDRSELARDLKRLRESDSEMDRAIVAGWDAYLHEHKAAEAKRDEAEREKERQAAEDLANAPARRAAEYRAEQERALSPYLRDTLKQLDARIAALEQK